MFGTDLVAKQSSVLAIQSSMLDVRCSMFLRLCRVRLLDKAQKSWNLAPTPFRPHNNLKGKVQRGLVGINQGQIQQESDNLLSERSKKMHEGAKKSKKKGIWKVGDKHVQDMKKIKYKFFSRPYNLILRNEFNELYQEWRNANPGILNQAPVNANRVDPGERNAEPNHMDPEERPNNRQAMAVNPQTLAALRRNHQPTIPEEPEEELPPLPPRGNVPQVPAGQRDIPEHVLKASELDDWI